MDCFNQAVSVVLTHEGGFSNNEHDPGGATNFGISLRWLKSEGLYGDLDDDGDVDIADILSIDHDIAVRIYREKWWNKYLYDRFVDCEIATKVFDMSVNMGARQAHLLLQRALNSMQAKLSKDGVIGPLTLAAANRANSDELLEAIRLEQKRFYLHLIAKRPSLSVFKKGWLRRASA